MGPEQSVGVKHIIYNTEQRRCTGLCCVSWGGGEGGILYSYSLIFTSFTYFILFHLFIYFLLFIYFFYTGPALIASFPQN